MTKFHCNVCRDLINYFSLDEEDQADLARWHDDHPDWSISEKERRDMDAFEGMGL